MMLQTARRSLASQDSAEAALLRLTSAVNSSDDIAGLSAANELFFLAPDDGSADGADDGSDPKVDPPEDLGYGFHTDGTPWRGWYPLPTWNPSSKCCCPLELRFEGAGPGGSYDFPFDRKQAHPLFGHKFKNAFKFEWRPSNALLDCKLEWLETSSNRNERHLLDADGNTKEIVVVPANTRTDRLLDVPTSSTFKEWGQHFGLPQGHSKEFQGRKRTVSPAIGEPITISLIDTPAVRNQERDEDGNVTSEIRRDLDGEVIIKSGCPACDDLSVSWAQKSGRSHFKETENFFTHSQDDMLAKGENTPFAASTKETPRDHHLHDGETKRREYAKWRAEVHERWGQQGRLTDQRGARR